MPCYTQQSSVVELGQQTDVKLLAKALEGLGYTVWVQRGTIEFSQGGSNYGSFKDGRLTVTGLYSDEEDKKVFKRAYSTEVVRAASARFGWQVKESAPNTFQVVRRS